MTFIKAYSPRVVPEQSRIDMCLVVIGTLAVSKYWSVPDLSGAYKFTAVPRSDQQLTKQ